MSRKTVTFKMPTPEAPPPEDGRGPDEWVRRGDMDEAALAPIATLHGSAAPGRATLDLAAERGFGEMLALSLVVPPMLGCFWLLHAMRRYEDAFG
jgi:hypothetical protein